VKLIAYFKHFLDTTVNLNDDRIATLNQRVDAITSFLRDHEFLGEYFIDVIPQGSYAHRTIIKPVGTKEYDADVLLSLKEHPEWTPKQYTAELKKAFEGNWRYTGKTHKRTRCVYVDYADEFHIDVVPYVESTSNITNNKTDDWEYTDPQAFTAWLEGKDRIVGGGRLPAVLRLLKYLRDSKGTFSIKSVLLTILVGERVQTWNTTTDEKYYADLPTALVHILEDLDTYLQANYWMPVISDPAGTGQDFSQRWDQDGYANFRAQIHFYAGKVREAYDETSWTKSLAAWQAVFGNRFQAPQATEAAALSRSTEADPGEQFIDRTLRIPLRITQRVRLVGRVRKAGVQRAYDLPQRGDRVGKNRDIDFRLEDCSVAAPYDVYWKVKNTGREATGARQLRGQVERGSNSRYEHTSYAGAHYVEVYIVKNGVCVARDRQPVIIQPKMGV
jgi:Second Messenger Oligonucleotide or Dinucleotide Synthetase domain/Adenylyl/Guanylyl and SMODS C-terminal sensor domain